MFNLYRIDSGRYGVIGDIACKSGVHRSFSSLTLKAIVAVSPRMASVLVHWNSQ